MCGTSKNTNHRTISGQLKNRNEALVHFSMRCENDAFHFCPLLRGEAEHLWRKTKRERHQAERRSSSAPLTLHPTGLFAPPLCLSLCFLYGDLLHVLCTALRKCSTPRSAGGGAGGGRLAPAQAFLYNLCPFFCLSLSV